MKKLIAILTVLVVAGSITNATAQAPDRKKQFNIDKGALAISGYDPVAYFTVNKAVQGKKELSINASGIIYHFSTVQNKELFKANPAKYEPQYGGWCAYAMGATGEKVEVDPEKFKVLNGSLYLFYHSWAYNTLSKWNKDENKLKAKADLNWMKFN